MNDTFTNIKSKNITNMNINEYQSDFGQQFLRSSSVSNIRLSSLLTVTQKIREKQRKTRELAKIKDN